MPNDTTTTTTTRPVAARDLRTGDRVQLMPDYVLTVVDDPRLITHGWHAGRDQYRLATYADGADGPSTSRVNGDAIYRVIVDDAPEPEPEPRRVHHHNMTGDIPAEHLADALAGVRDGAEPGDYVRIEWPHTAGWVEIEDVQRVRVSPAGDVHVTATVRRLPTLGNLYGHGDRFTGWISPGRGDVVSLWQEIPVSADNFDAIY